MTYDLDPKDIENWADRFSSKGQLPRLIRKLLRSTLSDRNPDIDMPSDSSVYFPGWDGIVRVVRGNSWAPDGVSGWELTCDKDIEGKANENYMKRTIKPDPIDNKNSTFVFVTPRRWNGKKDWVTKRCQENQWREVRAYDANDLVDWLEQSEEVMEWFINDWNRFPNAFRLIGELDRVSTYMDPMKDNLERLVSLLDSEHMQEPEHKGMSDILDKTKDYIQGGLILRARTELEKVSQEATQLPTKLRIRYLTNLAFCELSEDRFDEAIGLIQEVHEIQPDHPVHISNASLAARLQHDYDRALELAQKAYDIDRSDPIIAANLISSLWELGQIDQLESFIKSNEWMLREPDSADAIAKIRIQQDRYEDAEEIYRSLVEIESDNHHAYVGLSQSLIARALTDRMLMMYSGNLETILCEAESAATQAIDILEHTQFTARRCEVLLLRAYARTRLEKLDEAMHDTDSVLDKLPENDNAFQQKGILLLKKNDPTQARLWLEKIQDTDIRDNSLLPLADAYLESGDAKTAISLLKDNLSLDPPEWEDLVRAQTLMRAESKAGYDDSIGPILKTALEQHPHNPILFALSAVRSSLRNDTQASVSALIKAIGFADGPFKQLLQSKLGHLYVELGLFADAAKQFDEVCGDDIAHPDVTPLMLSLSNSGQYSRALNIARRFRNEMASPPREALDVEASMLGYAGDVEAAALCYHELCSRSDSTVDDLAQLALVLYRCGDHSGASEIIAKIDTLELSHNPHILMSFANLKRFLGNPSYIDDAYASLQFGREDPNLQMKYLALFRGANKDWKEPVVIGPGCFVRIRINGEENWWHIAEESEHPVNERELPPDNEVAKNLIGRSVGDTFDLQQGIGKITYEVVELQSKYVRTFQKIFDEFPIRFPGNHLLSHISEDDGFASIFLSIESRHQQVKEFEMHYGSKPLPFVSLCSLINSPVIMTWNEYTKFSNKQFFFGHGSAQEAEEGFELLCNAESITLDITALLTIHRLNLFSYVQSRFSCVSIPQLVFDEIQEEIIHLRMDGAPSGVMGKNEEGQYTLSDVTEDAWREWNEYALSVLESAKALKRIPSYPLLSVDEPDKVFDILRPSGVGAVYLGNENLETDSVLVSDDLSLSEIARTQEIPVVNSQSVLEELLRSDTITDEIYASRIEELTLMNYWYVRVGANDLLRRLKSSQYQTTPGILAMLRTLGGPHCSENAAVNVAIFVIDSLAKSRLLPEQYELFLSSVLTETRRGRFSNSILLEIGERISVRLRLYPIQLEQTLQVIESLLQTPPPK